MATNIYRFSILGETLEDSLKALEEKKGTNNELLEKIREKFDEVANRNIKNENTNGERSRSTHVASINAIEHEFKYHDNVWRFLLKKVSIKLENQDINTDYLKGNTALLVFVDFFASYCLRVGEQ